MPLQATSGAASYDAFGGGVPFEPTYIEQIFATHLYTGNGSSQTITNGIDLAGEGGLVWLKKRNSATNSNHQLADTSRGVNNTLISNLTDPQYTSSTYLTAFNSDGFSIGSNGNFNQSGDTFVSWTFREQPKFFDVVTYTGTGTTMTVPHNLGAVPGCMIVKGLNAASAWDVYHQSLGPTQVLRLSTTDAASGQPQWDNTAPTSTVFTVKGGETTNVSGRTYVAYLFAHNAGGFGLTGTDNVISCGSYTGNGSATGPVINLGYEPQWILIKNATTSDTGTGWRLFDTMRGITTGGTDGILFANSSNAEVYSNVCEVNATGFQITATGTGLNSSGDTFIYIAIRRGPMQTPTTGTSVFNVDTTANGTLTPSMAYPDTVLNFNLAATAGWQIADRLRGFLLGFPSNTSGAVTSNPYLVTNSTAAESTSNCRIGGLGIARGTIAGSWIPQEPGVIASGNFDTAYWFKRAPGFFDEVCYTGTGSARTVTHNLGVAPELMIVKRRSGVADWPVYSSAVGNTKFLLLNSTGDTITDNVWNNTTPTATEFSVRDQNTVNASGSTYVAYLFASVAGVSKVGSYTGTGTTQIIDCGFTSGARFVLIKRSSGTGDWYVWDTARGIVSGNDPYLLLNSTAAEVTNTDYIDTASTGFEISSTAPAAINANGGTFVFLAIA